MSQEVARLHATVGADTNELHSKLNQASKGIDTFRRETEGAGAGVQSFFDRVASTAGGMIPARLFEQLADGIRNFATSAIQATAQLQYMEVGITGLLAREISKGELVTETYQVVTAAAGSHAGANKKLMESQEKLTAKVSDYSTHLAIAAQKEAELGSKKNVSASQTLSAAHAVETYSQKLNAAQGELDAVNEKLTDQTAASYAVSTATRQMRVNTMDIADAYPLATVRAKELMDELAKLAIVSPYQLEMVNSTFKTAMAFGYTSKEAMSYTKALLNVASGVGATNEMLHRMAYNFAQIRMVGQVTKTDLRQLAMAGFDLNSVLVYTGQKFGILINDYTDFNKAIAGGQITWEQFTEAFAEYSEVNFGKASEIMSTTIMGLQSTFKDIFALTMPAILRPALEEVNQRLTTMLNLFLDIRESGILDEMGANLATSMRNVLKPVDRVLTAVQRFRDIQKQLKITNLPADMLHQLGGEMQGLSGGMGTMGVLAKAIFGDETGDAIIGKLKWVKTHLEDIKAVVIGFGTVFAGLKIVSIIGALITTLGALASPVMLLITLSGLLVAAYIRDWGGIRTAVDGFWEKSGKPVFTQIVDWAKVKIPEALKGIKERWGELTTWAGDFWGRVQTAYKSGGVEGVLSVVSADASRIGGQIIASIREKVIETWPTVAGKIGELGAQIPAMMKTWWQGTEVPGEFGTIKTPGMQAKMIEMGNQLGEWLIQGMTDFAKWAEQIATSFKAWATSDTVQTGAKTAGTDVGNILLDAIDALIGSEGSQTATTLAFKGHLMAAAKAAGEASWELLGAFNEGLGKAINNRVFGLSDKQMADVERVSKAQQALPGTGVVQDFEESPVMTAAVVAMANKHGGIWKETMEESLAKIGERWDTSILNKAATDAGSGSGSAMIDALVAAGDVETASELMAASDRWAAALQQRLDSYTITLPLLTKGEGMAVVDGWSTAVQQRLDTYTTILPLLTKGEDLTAVDTWAALVQRRLDAYAITLPLRVKGEALAAAAPPPAPTPEPAPARNPGEQFISKIPRIKRADGAAENARIQPGYAPRPEGQFIFKIPLGNQDRGAAQGTTPPQTSPPGGVAAGGITINFNAPVSKPEEARRQAKIGVMEGLRARGLA